MSTLLLDTSVCIDLLRGDAPHLAAALPRHRGGPIVVSAITLAELRVGEERRTARSGASVVDDLLAPFDVMAFDVAAADTYGRVRTALERRGTPIGPLDTLIAAHALALDATVVTANLREFRRVPGLRVTDSPDHPTSAS
jgi:tRNA(fMet)-specific endonuclease VapC